MPTDPAWLTSLFEAYPTLGDISTHQRRTFRSLAVHVDAPAGATLFEPADFCSRFPFVIRGTARVLKVGGSAPDTLLYRLQPGEHCLLSSAGLLARWRFGARVVAETEVLAAVIPGALFRDLVLDSQAFAHSVHLAVARRLEVVMDLVQQATYFRLDRRIASLILAQGSPLRASHQDLADDLGVSRENVSRVLGGFRDHGWLKLGRRRIEVLDAAALESFLDGDR